MIFMVLGLLKPTITEVPPSIEPDLNEHLGPSAAGLKLAGFLRDSGDRPRGFLGLLEAESFEHAQSYLDRSPLYEAALYDRSEALRFAIEVGRLG